MKSSLLCLLVVLLPVVAAAQSFAGYYRLPIDGALSLSANYGELRPNHFHGGIDVRVGGVSGKPVYAVAEGYVSRVAVSAVGYGKAVYVAHPNGTTSVYGHLQTFAPRIRAFIEGKQYARRRFAVDEAPAEGLLAVAKGEVIGTAGNSGSSLAPHLHFELRDTPQQVPFDPFAGGCYSVPFDNVPPVFRNISFFSFGQMADSVACTALFYSQRNPAKRVRPAVAVPDTFYLGMDVIDRQNGTYSKLVPRRVAVWLDSTQVFGCLLDNIGFDVSRHINSAIAYEERIRHGQVLLKTYIEPGNGLSIYEHAPTRGLIALRDTLDHTLTVTAIDDAGNRSSTAFTVRKRSQMAAVPCDTLPAGVPVWWQRAHALEKNGLLVSVPAGALYRSVRLSTDTLLQRPPGALSPLWRIHTPETPLQRSISIDMAADRLPDSLRSKALLAMVSPGGEYVSAGGSCHGESRVHASVRTFGDFFVTVDTVPPVLRPQFRQGEQLGKRAQLRIKISDNLSGIADYNAYIDSEWALFEYDAKNSVLIYYFDAKRIRRSRKHELLLTATDGKQNTASLQTWFVW